jgi:tetratricopeptide (TPR) repeat protein
MERQRLFANFEAWKQGCFRVLLPQMRTAMNRAFQIKQARRVLVVLFFSLSLLSCGHRKASGEDNLCFEGQLKKAEDSLEHNPAFARQAILKAIQMAKDSDCYYEAKEAYAKYYYKCSKFDSSLCFRREVLKYWSRQPESKKKSDALCVVYNSLCGLYNRLGQPDSALVSASHALKYCSQKKAPDIYINMADIYKFKGEYAQAMSCLRNALSVSDRTGNTELKFPIYNGMGDLFLALHDFENSDYYYSQAEKEYNQRSTAEKEVFCNNRANYYYYAKDFKKAELWFQRGRAIAEEMNDSYMARFIYTNLADVYLNLKEYRLSLLYADKAQPYFDSIHFELPVYYLNVIRLGVAMRQGNSALATQLNEKVKDDRGIDPSIISIRNKYVAQMYTEQGNYKEALRYVKMDETLNDSIRNEINQKRIAEIVMRYRQDTTLLKKEMLIRQQKAEVKNLRLGYYIWILALILILITGLYIYFFVKHKHAMQRQSYIEQINHFRVSNIRNRISPHFMFNVLNHEMEGFGEEKKKRFFILVHLLRRSLEMAETMCIKLSDEVAFAKDYLELEGYRAGDNLHVTWNIDNDVDMDHTHIIPMMLQIPIENALKHGLPLIEGEKLLTIDIKTESYGVRIRVTDNGIGYHPENNTGSQGTGTGLRVLRQSMQILNSRNEEKLTFDIHNIDVPDQHGTCAEIFIPYHYKFEYK